MVMKINDEGLRVIANLGQSYDALVDEMRIGKALAEYAGWKESHGREYLYIRKHGELQPKSYGLRNASTEKLHDETIAAIADHRGRLSGLNNTVLQYCAQYRALRLPVITSLPGKIIRDLDLNGHLGSNLFIEGTNCFPAYEIEARERFAFGLDETEDFDLGWCRGAEISFGDATDELKGSPLLDALLRVDKTFRINPKKKYQAVNSNGYEVELLAAPSMFRTMSKGEKFDLLPVFNEQEWLLNGKPVRHVISDISGYPVPLFVPDPRWMSLHKLWLSRKPERNPAKRGKDEKQGRLLFKAVAEKMQVPYPMNADFVLSLPEELRPLFDELAEENRFIPGNSSKPDWF